MQPLDFNRLADGRLHSLKRGRDFAGDPRAAIRQLRQAAARHGRTVRVVRDDLHRDTYLWVQSAHAEAVVGEPCPRCGGTHIQRTHPSWGDCSRCGARLMLLEPDPSLDAEDGQPAGRNARDLTHLSAYREVHVETFLRTDRQEQARGLGVLEDGTRVLLVVTFPLLDGERVPDPSMPGWVHHRVRAIAAEPFSEVFDLDALLE